MLINTVPDDFLMYIGFILIFNIAFIVNVFMLTIEKKRYFFNFEKSSGLLNELSIFFTIELIGNWFK